jgi:hypothetical protein
MATYTKELLSNSSSGRPILVTGTNTATATSIHVTSSSNTNIDEVWLYATTNAVSVLSIEFGSNTNPNDVIPITMEANQGVYICVPGLILKGNGSAGSNITAFASTANVVRVTGYVNRIAP